MLQRLTFQQLHYYELACLVLAYIVNRAGVRMSEGGGRACFPPESLDRNRVCMSYGRQKFERNHAAKPSVFGFVDDAHSPAAKFFQNPIVGNCAASDSQGILILRFIRGLPVSEHPCPVFKGGNLQEILCLSFLCEEGLDFAAQGVIARAGFFQEGPTLALRYLQCRVI